MVFFNGQFLIQPQTAVYVDDSQLANLGPQAPQVLSIVGPSTAGDAQQVVTITDPTQARRVYRSGDLLDAILLAFAPSAQTGGATTIKAVRVNSAIQSKAKIFDNTSPLRASGTVTIAGTPASGNVVTATIHGVAISYTCIGGDTTATTAGGLANAINASINAIILDALVGVTAFVTGSVVTILCRYFGVDGNAVTLTASATGGGATATASAANLTGGVGNTLATLTSDDYGLYTNQFYFSVAAGSVQGNKFTVGLTTNGNVIGGTLIQDNLYRALLTIQYIGSGSACTLTVNDNTLTTSATGAPSDNLNISFGIFTTIQQISDFINAHGSYEVTVTAQSSALLNTQGQFDPVTAQDIKTTSEILTGNLQAIIDFINSPANIYCSAVRQTNPVSGQPAYNVNNSYFVGGSDGTTTVTDWTNSLATLQTIDTDIVVPVSDSAAVHAATLAHVTYMSGAPGRYRVAIVGGALNEYQPTQPVPTITITNRAIPLNSNRVVLVSPGVNYYDVNGNLQNGSSKFTAALFGGMLSAVNAGTPLTHKTIDGIAGLETLYSPADLDALLLGGVAPIQYVIGTGFRIVQSKTTWLGQPLFDKTEISTVLAVDSVVRLVKDNLDAQIIGQIVSPTTLRLAMSVVESTLITCQSDNFIVGDPPGTVGGNPAFKNISASTQGGDTIYVSWQMSPAIPANYVLCSISLVPYSGTAVSAS